jgi:competence protein ComEA
VNRTAWSAVVLLGLVASGIAVRQWPASRAPTLDCAPSEVRLDAEGVARCDLPADARPLPAQALLGLGGRLDLNRVSEMDLAQVPGVGRALARSIVEARTAGGPFRSWEDVDDVSGVGPTKLRALQAATEIR